MAGASDPEELVLQLHLRPGAPVSGWVQPAGGANRTPFHGWVELMVVVDALRLSHPSSQTHGLPG